MLCGTQSFLRNADSGPRPSNPGGRSFEWEVWVQGARSAAAVPAPHTHPPGSGADGGGRGGMSKEKGEVSCLARL